MILHTIGNNSDVAECVLCLVQTLAMHCVASVTILCLYQWPPWCSGIAVLELTLIEKFTYWPILKGTLHDSLFLVKPVCVLLIPLGPLGPQCSTQPLGRFLHKSDWALQACQHLWMHNRDNCKKQICIYSLACVYRYIYVCIYTV